MSARAQLIVMLIALAGLVSIIWMVRRQYLKERFAILWIVVAAGMIGLVLARPLLDQLSEFLGIRSGTSTLFLIAMLFLLAIVLYLSVAVSRMEEKIRDVAEAYALLVADQEEASDTEA